MFSVAMTQARPDTKSTTNEAFPVTPGTLRADIEKRRAAGERYTVREIIAVMVPVLVEAAERHSRGETFALSPSAIQFVAGKPSAIVLATALVAPKHPRDRACMAPEQRAGKGGDAASTVFSVGAIIYEMLTGANVGPGMRRPRDLVPTLAPQIEIILGKSMIANPQHRPADVGALAQALHHFAPTASQAPPPADETALDRGGGGDFDVDITMSLMPPPVAGPAGQIPRAASVPSDLMSAHQGLVEVAHVPEAPTPPDPTSVLADLKARLESDPRPRYVVIKEEMDHGPFNAIELLQQIASHTFEANHILLDNFSNDERPIADWEEFAPFAEHAKLNRAIVAEKKELERSVVAETKATRQKGVLIASIMAGVVVAGLAVFLTVRSFTRREIVVETDQALNIDTDAGLRGQSRKGPGGGTWTGGGSGGPHPVLRGGMSCEQAMDTYVTELKMSGNKPDLTAGSFGSILNNGGYVIGCGAPMSMTVNICAAIQNGRAVGVSVSTDPPNPGIASCVAGRVRGMGFPSHPALDVTRTVFKGQ
jgi:eukaryotic-like serine/threonine-protein kinase